MRSWQAGDGDRPAAARHHAYAVDHAALVDAFTRLAEATGEARWIAEARTVADTLLERFWDPDKGGLFTTGEGSDAPVVRQKDFLDNATPAANSLAAVGPAAAGRPDRRGRATGITPSRSWPSSPPSPPTPPRRSPTSSARSTCTTEASPRSSSPATAPTWSPRCSTGTCLRPCWPGASASTQPAVGGPGRRQGLRLPELRLPDSPPRPWTSSRLSSRHRADRTGARSRCQSASIGRQKGNRPRTSGSPTAAVDDLGLGAAGTGGGTARA